MNTITENVTLYDLMFSVETNSISFIGLAIDGVYSIIKVPSELCNCFGDVTFPL
jgi:hypothetical protein